MDKYIVTHHNPNTSVEEDVDFDTLPAGFYIMNQGTTPTFVVGPYPEHDDAVEAWIDPEPNEGIVRVGEA